MNGRLDGERVELWLEYEHEAMRYGVDVAISHEDLAELVEVSVVLIDAGGQRRIHETDFQRWGRRGGIRTLERYGPRWFSWLGRRRHGRATKAELQRARMVLGNG